MTTWVHSFHRKAINFSLTPVGHCSEWNISYSPEMASMSFSSIFTMPVHHIHCFTQTRTKATWTTASCMSFIPINKTSYGSSNSAFFQHEFLTYSSVLSRVFLKSRYSTFVYARAATEKSLHDFTVKVYVCFGRSITWFFFSYDLLFLLSILFPEENNKKESWLFQNIYTCSDLEHHIACLYVKFAALTCF